MELVFECQNYTEEKKVKLAATEFSGYVDNQWEQIMHKRRHIGMAPVTSLYEMKTLMKARFVPNHYGRDLYQKLRRLTQGAKSVEDYFQEMETLMIKANVNEDDESTLARCGNQILHRRNQKNKPSSVVA